MNGVVRGVLIGLLTTAIMASAKSFVDVERLKIKVESLFELTKDTNDRIKVIEKFILIQKYKEEI